MIHRVLSLFLRYAARHGQIEKTGFLLYDSVGKPLGSIESIIIQEGRLSVEGWSLADKVGLTNAEASIELVPNRSRDDVRSKLGDHIFRTPGFALDMPFTHIHTVFWADTARVRYVYALPQITLRDTRAMQMAQIVPFMRDSVLALPAAFQWLRHRDPISVARVKAALRLNPVARSNKLNTLLFSADVDSSDSPPENLYTTGISIIVPVYNALDLLPEVLQRVVQHTDLPWRLIVVEDKSSDDRVRAWLHKWKAELDDDIAGRVTLIENDANLGFIRSVNRALAEALAYGDHVVLLNSDAFVPVDWASRLIRPILDHHKVATVTPMSNDAEIFSIPNICQREQLQSGNADAIDRVAAQFFPGADLADAPTGVGFCMAINIDALKQLPLLDTVFGRGYGEEVDWCQKARKLGWRHLGTAGLFVEHRGSASFGTTEKLKLVQQNNDMISRRYPRYDAEVQEFINNDPLNTPRLALAFSWIAQCQRGRVPVYVAHNLGGGAELYLQNRLGADLNDGVSAVVLRLGGVCRWQIELHSPKGVNKGETDSTNFVARLLDLLPSRHLVYSCAVGDRDPLALPQILTSLAEGPEDRIEVLIHDFLPISPSYTLLNSDGGWGGVPMPEIGCDPAHETKRPDGRIVDLGEWRSNWGILLGAAHEIRCFSDSSYAIVARAYPQVVNKLTIKPHRLIKDVPKVLPGQSEDGIPVIGVLGNIGYHKGIAFLRDLSRLMAQTGQARLVVIGNVDPAYPLASSALVHGTYKIADIPTLVARYGISRWLIPSIWPETFSYTTHEAIATALPVFGFDLGAQGDAIRQATAATGRGGVIPLDGLAPDPKMTLAMLLEQEATN